MEISILYKVSLLLMSTISMATSQGCPITSCTCEDGDGQSGRKINCRDKRLSQIPTITQSSELFAELTFSTSQEPGCSTCNNITSIPDNAFTGLRVKKLDLGKLSVSQFSSGAFNGLEQDLAELVLYGDNTISPPYSAIGSLSQLTSLHLENFNQGQIDNTNTFHNFPNLKTLVLKNLQINHIAGNSFENKLQQLTRLEIVINPLLLVPVSALRPLVSLEHLSLIQIQINTIPAYSFEKLTNLTELDLSYNGISTLDPKCFEGIQERLELLLLHLNNLDQTAITELQQGNWTNLEQLNLGHNKIRSLPTGLFSNMKKLAYVNLISNGLSTLQRNAFQDLRNMHKIDLGFNDITQIESGIFKDLHLLRELHMTSQSEHFPNHQLNFTPEAVQGLENTLSVLDLTNTKLVESTAWRTIEVLTDLQVLHIANTSLHSIEDFVFRNHNKLMHLFMNGAKNNITQISQKSFHGLKDSLQTIDLTNNYLTQIDRCVFKNFSKLKDISLRNVPLHCDCSLLWLYDWIKEKTITNPLLPYLVQAICKSPANLADQQLDRVNRNFLVCDSGYVQPTCVDYYATTTPVPTTSTTTTAAVPTAPTYSLTLSIVSSTTETVRITWSIVGDKSYISSYTVTYQKLGTTSAKKSISVDKAAIQFEVDGLDAGSQYEVCIYIITSILSATSQFKCEVARTEETVTKAPLPVDEGLQPGVIAGIVVGAVIAVGIIIAFICILIRTNQRNKAPNLPQPAVMPHTFAPIGTPRTGYDSKRFSKPKKTAEQNGKDLTVNVISTGKMDDERNRVSAGSYQFLNEKQRLSQEPMPSSGKLEGANGTSHDVRPTRQSGGRYANDPFSKPPPYNQHHYANDSAGRPPDHYVNNMDSRPLPKKPRSYENESSGFLNHGFSPEDHQYHEIKDTMI